jgi:hypothetical protein
MADRQLRNQDNPLDPRNRRITILLPFISRATGEPPPVPLPTAPGNPGA